MLSRTDRELLGLALPALGALLAEPAFLLADSAIVGHLGTPQLAGLGIASAVMLNAVFLCIFLAHGTTAAVAREAGAGDLRRAYTLGIDGIWLAVAIGLGLAATGVPLAPVLVDLLGASGTAAPSPSPTCGSACSACPRCSSSWPRPAPSGG
jgi:Na+-driven multidrug efflux pump